MNWQSIGKVAKAIAAGIGAAASYFIGVLVAISPNAGFGDLNTLQWLGAVPVVLAVYGITWKVRNR